MYTKLLIGKYRKNNDFNFFINYVDKLNFILNCEIFPTISTSNTPLKSPYNDNILHLCHFSILIRRAIRFYVKKKVWICTILFWLMVYNTMIVILWLVVFQQTEKIFIILYCEMYFMILRNTYFKSKRHSIKYTYIECQQSF